MDYLVSLIVGESSSLDVYVIVRLVLFLLIMEFFSTICGILAGFKK